MPIFMCMKLTSSAKSDSMVFDQHPIKINKLFISSVFTVGATSVITQIILLREFLSILYGNELVIGIILANWLVLTGVGSFIGRYSDRIKNKMLSIWILLILIAILPVVTASLACVMRNLIFPVGTMIGLTQILCFSFVLLLPYCIVSGFSFALFAQTISEKHNTNLITNVYGWESAGSILGGFVVNFVMIFFFTTFQSLILLMGFNFVITFLISQEYLKPTLRYFFLLISIIVMIFSYRADLDVVSRKLLFTDQELLYYKDTPYGNLTITSQGNQKNFYENNILLFSTNDPTAIEEAVHYAMVQHPAPKKVLLISGGISGTIDEILKYSIDRIDYVEINPWIIRIGKNFTATLTNNKIRIINEDARLFVRQTSERYDVVLINLPSPSTAQLNRYYTVDFFKELKYKLNGGAVVSLGMLENVDYLGEEAREINSVMYNTIKASFQNVLIVPGMKNYFLASDSTLRIDIAHQIAARGIPTVYVNKYYIDDEILSQRSVEIHKTLEASAAFNEDLNPISYYHQVRYWLSQFESGWWITAIGAIIFMLVVIKNMDIITAGMFTGGFSASSTEIILLISFQVIYGYVYQMLGIIIMIFMGGLAVGSMYRHKFVANADINTYAGVQLSITLYSMILPLFLICLKTVTLSPAVIHVVFFLPTFIIGLLIGIEFSVAAKIQKGSVATIAQQLYGIDLFGSAIGALLTTAFLIPLLGIIKVCYVIAALNLVSGSIAFLNRKNYLTIKL
jgi:spermidine synthase